MPLSRGSRHQQLSLFNAHYDERCFLPIHVYDTAAGRPVAMILRSGKTPSGTEVRGHVRRLVRAIRRHWPTTRITIRGDGHYCRPEVMDWCEAQGVVCNTPAVAPAHTQPFGAGNSSGASEPLCCERPNCGRSAGRPGFEVKIIPDSINVYYGCDDSSFSEDIECPEWADRSAVIWRYGSLEDIANFHTNATLLSEAARANKGHALWSEVGSEANYDKSHELLKYFAGSIGLPQTFLILAGVYVPGCGGDESNFWYFAMSTPKIALEAALVRNATGRPIRIDSIMGEEVADGPLRIADDAAPTGVQPMSLGMLIQPGHSLLVPTRIILKPNPSYQLYHDASVGSAATFRRLRSKGFTARDNVFAVPELNDFTFGPELKVTGLGVEGNAIDFREKPLNDMEIAFSAQVGSCPYLLSWDEVRADWTQHGKVLHEASDISREETQTITLPGFVSRFRLEEREPEVATISDAEIAFSLKNGGSITLTPDTAPSAKVGQQLLFWGDALQLEFSLPSGIAPADVVQSRLSLTGYYERYSSLPNSAYRGGAAFSSDTAFVDGAIGCMPWESDRPVAPLPPLRST